MNILLSVILPTYNVASYLLSCLESIERQTYRNFEVLVVIDGATDGSYEIATTYSEKHSRFHVVWQENMGSGPARNKGLELAKGDFIVFIDPDDYVSDDYLEKLLALQERDDNDLVIVGGYTEHINSDGFLRYITKEQINPLVIEGEDNLKRAYPQLFQTETLDAPHHRLYRKAIIDYYNIRFPDIRRSQDIVFNLRFYSRINKLCFDSYCGYYYRAFEGPRKVVNKDVYCKAVSYIYREWTETFESWGLLKQSGIVENTLYRFAHNLIFLTYMDKNTLISLWDDDIFVKILTTGHPQSMHMNIVRWLMLHEQYSLLYYYFSLTQLIKQRTKK